MISRYIGTQISDGVTALPECLLGREDCIVHRLHCRLRPSRQQVASSLKLKQEAVKALQQGVMELSCNTYSFVQPLIESRSHCLRVLSETQQVEGITEQGQRQKCDQTEP